MSVKYWEALCDMESSVAENAAAWNEFYQHLDAPMSTKIESAKRSEI